MIDCSLPDWRPQIAQFMDAASLHTLLPRFNSDHPPPADPKTHFYMLLTAMLLAEKTVVLFLHWMARPLRATSKGDNPTPGRLFWKCHHSISRSRALSDGAWPLTKRLPSNVAVV